MTPPLEALRLAIGREHDVPLADLSAPRFQAPGGACPLAAAR